MHIASLSAAMAKIGEIMKIPPMRNCPIKIYNLLKMSHVHKIPRWAMTALRHRMIDPAMNNLFLAAIAYRRNQWTV